MIQNSIHLPYSPTCFCVYNSLIFYGSSNGTVRCYSNGQVLWSLNKPKPYSLPLISSDDQRILSITQFQQITYFITSDSKLQILDPVSTLLSSILKYAKLSIDKGNLLTVHLQTGDKSVLYIYELSHPLHPNKFLIAVKFLLYN